jgi:hypothetical protein
MNVMDRDDGQATDHLETKTAMPDYASFSVWEGKQSWFTALLEFLRQRTSADLGLTGALVSLTIIGCKVAGNADRLTPSGLAAIICVALLVAGIGLVSLLKGTNYATTTKNDAHPPVESGDVRGIEKETRKPAEGNERR